MGEYEKINYNNIKVKYNGAQVTPNAEPFILDGATYVPLRTLEQFGKNIAWDGSSYTISVTDKPDATSASLQAEINSLKSQLATKDSTITSLRNEIADLKDDDDDDDDDIDDVISDMEEQLQDDYEDYFEDDYDITLDISLDGDEDDLDLDIEIDEGEYGDIDDEDEILDMVQDMAEDIWDESDLEDAEINITFKDEDGDKQNTYTGDPDEEEVEED